MRGLPIVVVLLVGSVLLSVAGCNQDSYASNPERDTHTGDMRAVADPGLLPAAPGGSSAAATDSAPPAPAAPAADAASGTLEAPTMGSAVQPTTRPGIAAATAVSGTPLPAIAPIDAGSTSAASRRPRPSNP